MFSANSFYHAATPSSGIGATHLCLVRRTFLLLILPVLCPSAHGFSANPHPVCLPAMFCQTRQVLLWHHALSLQPLNLVFVPYQKHCCSFATFYLLFLQGWDRLPYGIGCSEIFRTQPRLTWSYGYESPALSRRQGWGHLENPANQCFGVCDFQNNITVKLDKVTGVRHAVGIYATTFLSIFGLKQKVQCSLFNSITVCILVLSLFSEPHMEVRASVSVAFVLHAYNKGSCVTNEHRGWL